jgi:hypothetical protein
MPRAAWNLFWICLLICGCHTLPTSAEPDPLVEHLFQQGQKSLGTLLKNDVLQQEIPLGMPLSFARAKMQGHGFSCWTEVPDDKGMCLHCTAFKSTPRPYKIVVKLFYDPRLKVITGTDAVVEYDAWHFLHGA